MNKFFLFLIGCTLASCTKEFDLDKFPQEWKLITMTANQITSSMTTGADMEWQEMYTLKSNGTFTKSRDRKGIITEAIGSFVFTDSPDCKYLELTYETGIALITSCTPGKEILWIRSDTKMQGTWSACDGLGLEYERIR
jgi:hypothetical protein